MDKKIAKQLLFGVTSIMEEYSISVFISDGTCLGAYREQDFIEWDYDVDILARAEELIPYMDILKERFEKEGYNVRSLYYSESIHHGFVLRFKGVVLDIHGMYLISGKRWRLKRRITRNRTTYAYPVEWFENPDQIEFLGRKIFIPTPEDKYLEALYGNGYMIPKNIQPRKSKIRYKAEYIKDQINVKDIPRFKMKEV